MQGATASGLILHQTWPTEEEEEGKTNNTLPASRQKSAASQLWDIQQAFTAQVLISYNHNR